MTQDSELLYRSNLESVYGYIKDTYGDERRVLNMKDITTYTGFCYRTVKKKYFKKGSKSITAENFARMLAKML